jgi:hypothetical protein
VQKGILLGEIISEVKPELVHLEPQKKYQELTVHIKGRGAEKRIKNQKDHIYG